MKKIKIKVNTSSFEICKCIGWLTFSILKSFYFSRYVVDHLRQYKNGEFTQWSQNFFKVAFIFYPAKMKQDISINASLGNYLLKTKRPNKMSKKSNATS